jgi:hypothetical protein
MPFQAYNRFFISDKPITNVCAGDQIVGSSFRVRYPSYRGTFLSCIESFSVFLDGAEVPSEAVYFEVNGKQFLLDELKDLFKEYWFVRDEAAVFIRRSGGLPAGSIHTVRVEMHHRIPYTGYFGQYLVLDSDESRTLAVQE